ncbi:ANTAR domain-containing protein [Streptomyces sp. NPDC005345]|uniref:ANTAR domain-containing protein n=1 Tax=Streptomyces sp. NPDC005345 TaxID=3156877 RepID=UPI0033A52E37
MNHEDHTWLEQVHSENDQLKHAARARAAVDQALGVLTARFHLPPDRGLDVLRALSQHLDEQLPDVATDIMQWGLGQPLRPAVEEELDNLVH